MVEYSSAANSMKDRFDAVWDEHERRLEPEVFQELDEHIDEVEGKNRGKTSSAMTSACDGPPFEPISLSIQNDASSRIIRHEIGHLLMDAHGIDATQEATDRASNKQNYDRWPQFSFGNKDSPPERFMFRRYGALSDIDLEDVTSFEYHEDRSDIFRYNDGWWETNTYRYTMNKHERKRYKDPIVWGTDVTPEYCGIKVCKLGTSHSKTVNDVDELQVANRYQLTPGLSTALGHDQEPDWEGLNKLVYELNRHWYDAVTKVRKRGEKRREGMKKSPRGPAKSYYVMNAHEFFAELHAVMMGEHMECIDRIERYCPGLIKAYEDVILQNR